MYDNWSYFTFIFQTFNQLLKAANKSRFYANSLTESFQIRQTIEIIIVMKSLANAFLVASVIVLVLTTINHVSIFMGKWEQNSNYNRGMTNVRYYYCCNY